MAWEWKARETQPSPRLRSIIKTLLNRLQKWSNGLQNRTRRAGQQKLAHRRPQPRTTCFTTAVRLNKPRGPTRHMKILRRLTDPENARSCEGGGWSNSSQRSLWSSPEPPPSSRRSWSPPQSESESRERKRESATIKLSLLYVESF